jgi:hypothetical protein
LLAALRSWFLFGYFVCFVVMPVFLRADPLSKSLTVDFFRDVPSRNLKGLATRSDGRLVPGPVLRELAGPVPAELLWCLERGASPTQWFVGTGPDGRILELTIDLAAGSYATRPVVKLDDAQVFAVRRLPDGTLLAGTSPKGMLCLVRDGQPVARVVLPVDSIFDLLVLPEENRKSEIRISKSETKGSKSETQNAEPKTLNATILVATGNPGRIYRVDLAKFAAAGLSADKITDARQLVERGVTVFGEIRDRNVRRLARLADGRIVAGSSPHGNIYAFPRDGSAPTFLQENREAEVTDLLPQPDGGLYATLVFTPAPAGEARIIRSRPPSPAPVTAAATPPPVPTPTNPGIAPGPESPPPDVLGSPTPERFAGRSTLVWFPPNGFPETLANRSNLAFYRVLPYGAWFVIAGGEQGDVLGYDPATKQSLTFAGSVAAQLNDFAALAGDPDRFLAIKNNAPGFALIDFRAAAPREAETRRLDFGVPVTLGALRFDRVCDLAPATIAVEAKTSNGTDDLEGWSVWTPLVSDHEDVLVSVGWHATDPLRGRYAKLRIKLPAAPAADAALDRATWYHLPQNRRPQLGEFRILSPNFALEPASEPAPSSIVTLSQLLGGATGSDAAADKRKNNFLNSRVVPAPGTQVVLWTVTDPDGDNLACTFSLRREGDTVWTDVAVNAREPFAQFEILHLPEGVYATRLVATEQAPRPPAERLSATFETDELVVDRTPPELIEATAKRVGDRVVLTVHGRDALTLLVGFEALFNNGVKDAIEQPVDGIRDSREETFVLDVPLARVADATNVEITLYDSAGNGVSRRLTW